MRVKLKDICTKITDGSHFSPIDTKNGYPMLSIQDMLINGFDYSKCKHISRSDYDSLVKNGCKPEKNDVLIAKDGSYLKEIFVVNEDKEEVVLSSIAILRPNTQIVNPHFLKYYLSTESVKDEVARKYVSGSVLKRIILKNFENIEIDLPDRKTQDKIVEILSGIDEQINRNDEAVKRLQVLAQTIYSRWFNQFEFPNNAGKPYKSDGGELVYNKELGKEIPKDWAVDNLYKIASFENGLACQKFRPLNDIDKLPVIKITEMHNGFTKETEFCRNDVAQTHIINNGDLLFSWSATLETQIWCRGKGVLNQHIFNVIPKEYFSKYYVYLQLTNYIQNFVKIAESRKTTMGHITTDHLKQSRIIVPPNDVINKFTDLTNPIYSEIINLNIENIKLIALKEKLLPLLINGQLNI